MSDAFIDYVRAGAIARIVLTQPARLNAITFDMWASLPALVARAEADADTRVIVVEGAGDKAFSAGADISQFGEQRSAGEAARAYEAAVRVGLDALAGAQKPTVGSHPRSRLRRRPRARHVLRPEACVDGRALSHPRRAARHRVCVRKRRSARRACRSRRCGRPAAHGPHDERERGGTAGRSDKAWPADAFEAERARLHRRHCSQRAFDSARVETRSRRMPQAAGRARSRRMDELVDACMGSADYLEGQAAFREKREPRFRGA